MENITIKFNNKQARYVAEMLDKQHTDLMDHSYTARKKGCKYKSNMLHKHSLFVAEILQKYLTKLKLGSVMAHEEIIER